MIISSFFWEIRYVNRAAPRAHHVRTRAFSHVHLEPVFDMVETYQIYGRKGRWAACSHSRTLRSRQRAELSQRKISHWIVGEKASKLQFTAATSALQGYPTGWLLAFVEIKFESSIWRHYCTGNFVVTSTKSSVQPDGPSCTLLPSHANYPNNNSRQFCAVRSAWLTEGRKVVKRSNSGVVKPTGAALLCNFRELPIHWIGEPFVQKLAIWLGKYLWVENTH